MELENKEFITIKSIDGVELCYHCLRKISDHTASTTFLDERSDENEPSAGVKIGRSPDGNLYTEYNTICLYKSGRGKFSLVYQEDLPLDENKKSTLTKHKIWGLRRNRALDPKEIADASI